MFNEAAVILSTKLGDASVQMCKNICAHLGKNEFESVTGACDWLLEDVLSSCQSQAMLLV